MCRRGYRKTDVRGATRHHSRSRRPGYHPARIELTDTSPVDRITRSPNPVRRSRVASHQTPINPSWAPVCHQHQAVKKKYPHRTANRLTAHALSLHPQAANDVERHETNGNAGTTGEGVDEAMPASTGAHGGGTGSSSKQPKKPRLVWTPELHMRFMNAVNHLGIKNAVPKTILQLMNVEGMTRENVASHLQKYRLYLKRLAGIPPSAPLPTDIMQRVHPFQYPGASTLGASAAMNAAAANPFAPTIEQMHAGVPPGMPTPGFPGESMANSAEAFQAQMAAAQFSQQFLSYMGASMGGFQAPGGPNAGSSGAGSSEEAARNAAAAAAAMMNARQTPMGYPGMPYGSPPMPGFMPPPWAQAMAPHPPHDDPSRR